jgi:colanic acid/amylovoran biosynthesis glycosyltransferase
VSTETRPIRMIAYLAPAFPAVSSTFVQDELTEVERRGIEVLPITLRRPKDPAPDQDTLAARTACVYDRPPLRVALDGLAGLFRYRSGAIRALGFLIEDMDEVGWTRRAAWKLLFQCLAAVRLADLLRAGQCQHLHVHFIHSPAQIAMYASALTGIPFTVTVHANDLFVHGRLLRAKSLRAKRIFAISGFHRRCLVEQGVAIDRVTVVRCAARLPAIDTRLPRPATRPFRIGTLGRLIEKKGIDVLVEALGVLVQSGHDLVLDIAGDGPLRGEIESQVQRLELAARVRFVGALSHREVAAWMNGLDAFALACKPDRNGDMDGIPVVLMEAMSLAIPVLTTRLSGIPELVIHERTGLKSEPGDVAGLAGQIARLIEDPALRSRLAEAGFRHVRGEFSSTLNVDRLLAGIVGGPADYRESDYARSRAAQEA